MQVGEPQIETPVAPMQHIEIMSTLAPSAGLHQIRRGGALLRPGNLTRKRLDTGADDAPPEGNESMFGLRGIAARIFGSSNDRRIAKYRGRVEAINAMEPEIEALSDEALRARTAMFREQLAQGKSLDELLVPAFATVREAAKRTLGQRHFDVQLIGGMVLHEGRIAEMKTGEGKTLVATLPVYLNALAGKGVHVVTVNDYLAKRDAGWMSEVYGFLGLTTGVIVHGLSMRSGARPMLPTSPMPPTTNWVSTTCATT